MEWMAGRRPAGDSDPLGREPRLPEPQHRMEDQQHPSTTACGRCKQPEHYLSSRFGQTCLHFPTYICEAKNKTISSISRWEVRRSGLLRIVHMDIAVREDSVVWVTAPVVAVTEISFVRRHN
ncbi:hypothetical protein ASPFODRAFT_79546 [Aspergillus luchuensis CBS 106.47]|uniref:Uncharacterized protein n=1 Tax=Aspergillus luchuensis (strain CBS 106.47) TaxID=1137211 RepID=A0A1M3TMQ4_ASPLC|nr:hypothetical protein ASPFODRAFT_79546 [Aspergillus luchuensis CBS 106.47]